MAESASKVLGLLKFSTELNMATLTLWWFNYLIEHATIRKNFSFCGVRNEVTGISCLSNHILKFNDMPA